MAGRQEDIYFNIPFEIKNSLQERIAQEFSAYDRNGTNVLVQDDVGSILRALGCVPLETDIREIVEETEFIDHRGEIHISKFVKFVEKMIADQKMKPVGPEILLEAFKLLDPENDCFIEKEKFYKLIKEHGEEMKEVELESMMRSAVDPLDGKIHYERYLRQLIYDPDDSVYKFMK